MKLFSKKAFGAFGVAAALTLLLLSCRRETPGAAAAGGAAPGGTKPKVARDVILITIDTLRYDAVGFDGNTRGTTPNLDRFAGEGRVFTKAHAHNVITLPSHTNILTGMLPYQHGVRENAGFRLSPKVPTAATRLKAKGYATGAFVGAYVLDSRYGLGHDFDLYDELYRHLDEQFEFEIQQAAAEDVVKAAIEWYRAQAGRPRFMWVHVYDPHAPYAPPPNYQERFADDFYLGEVAYTDSALGKLLDEVRAVQPSPLVVVTADHGEARGDHGELTHGLFCYEGTLHVPMFAWCPGLVASGRDDVPARHIDILPTILDAVGLPPSSELTGQSLLPAGRKEAEAGSYFEALSAAFNRGWAPLRGLSAGGDKYIDLPIPELYNLPSDPAETKNLVPQSPDSLRRLRKRFLELPTATTDRAAIGSEEAAKLRSLGYLTGSGELKASYGPADDPKTLIGVDQTLHTINDLCEREKCGEALPIARRVVAENPKMKLGYLHLAMTLRCVGDLEGVRRAFEQASANGVGGESVDRQRAMLLSELGRPKQALAVLRPYAESEEPETLERSGHCPGRQRSARGRAAGLCPGDRARPLQRDRLPEHRDLAPDAQPGGGGAPEPRSRDSPGQTPRAGVERPRSGVDASGGTEEGDRGLDDLSRDESRAVRRALQHRPRRRPARRLEDRAESAGELRQGGAAQGVRQGPRRGPGRARRHVPPRALSASR